MLAYNRRIAAPGVCYLQEKTQQLGSVQRTCLLGLPVSTQHSLVDLCRTQHISATLEGFSSVPNLG